MKIKSLTVLFLLTLATACGQKGPSDAEGTVKFSKGEVTMIRGDKSSQLKAGMTVKEGDKLQTGKKSLAVIIFKDTKLELQASSEISITSYLGKDKEMLLSRGNAWLLADGLKKDSTFRMRTPTSVAAVRGTKFYTFNVKGFTGTCHCEGDVDFENVNTGYKKMHHMHEMVFMKDGKTVLLTGKELKKIGFPLRHAHSQMKDSPLGPETVSLKPALMKALGKLIEKKMKAAKA